MQSDLRILLITPWFPTSMNPVSGIFVHEQALALSAQGVTIRILNPIPFTPPLFRFLKREYLFWALTPKTERVDGIEVDHPRYLTFPHRILFRHVGDLLFHAISRRVRQIASEWPFHLIHVHEAYPTGYAAVTLRNRHLRRIPTVLTLHRTSIDDVARHDRSCFVHVRNTLAMADHLIFVSRHGLALGLEYTAGMIRKKCSLITNGVSPARFTLNRTEQHEADLLRERYAGTFNILFVGNISPAKGILELIDAVRNWPAKAGDDIRLFLVGHNLMKGDLERFRSDSALGGRIVVTGPKPHSAIKIWMRFADVFVLPSHMEGVPTVLFEALFMGLPSVFTRVGGIPYVVRDREHVLLVEPRCSSALGSALWELRQNPNLRQALSEAGRRLVVDNFTWDKNAQLTREIYRRLLTAPRGGSRASSPRHAGHFPPS